MIGYLLLWVGFILTRTFGKHANHHGDMIFAMVLRSISIVLFALIVLNTLFAFNWLWVDTVVVR